MDIQFSAIESFSAATGIGAAVLDVSGKLCFASSEYEGSSEALHRLFTVLGCAEEERKALAYSIAQSQRFGGRYIFLAPSGLTYCASPLSGNQGVVAGPFLMTDYEEADIGGDPELLKRIPYKSPVQARASCELLALCAEHCGDVSGPFSVPYNEALAASVKHMDVIAKAVTYIRSNYMNKITLQEIAAHVFLSPTYFSKVFREETGQTPGGFIAAVRLDASKRLLRDPSVSIIDIPGMAGFESQSYFTRVFKKAEGQTPGEYRRRSRRE
ncbi:MAG: AraC family transcriptional regulator [Oscillospiraceae bacterium]|nr:AraC family transcriptional regulator [Oscillospiraceae bacterium]